MLKKSFIAAFVLGMAVFTNLYARGNLTVKFRNGLEFTMVFVEGGSFKMGSKNIEECPMHRVCLNDFYLSETEITQDVFANVMKKNPSYFKGEEGDTSFGNYPVDSVSWYDAIYFCNLLSIRQKLEPCYSVDGVSDPAYWDYQPCEGNHFFEKIYCNFNADGYRLPTEAEWEFAARGGNESRGFYYSGANNLNEVAWNSENSSSTNEVGKLKPNELGLYDMTGNVYEWCWDWFSREYYEASEIENPRGPISGITRVYRGGSWEKSNIYNMEWTITCRSKNGNYPDTSNSTMGFRIARTIK